MKTIKINLLVLFTLLSTFSTVSSSFAELIVENNSDYELLLTMRGMNQRIFIKPQTRRTFFKFKSMDVLTLKSVKPVTLINGEKYPWSQKVIPAVFDQKSHDKKRFVLRPEINRKKAQIEILKQQMAEIQTGKIKTFYPKMKRPMKDRVKSVFKFNWRKNNKKNLLPTHFTLSSDTRDRLLDNKMNLCNKRLSELDYLVRSESSIMLKLGNMLNSQYEIISKEAVDPALNLRQLIRNQNNNELKEQNLKMKPARMVKVVIKQNSDNSLALTSTKN